MRLGNFGQKLVASAKLSSMEKYGWAYMEDYIIVRDNLVGEVHIEELGNGRIKIIHNGREFEVEIRDWSGGDLEKVGKPKKVEAERKGWVSIWDVENH